MKESVKSIGAEDDPEFLRAVEGYMAILESGQPMPRREYVRRYPAFAAALDQCLAGLEAIHGAALPRMDRPAEPSVGALASKPLGDFQILCEIGRGGMGVVYEATQLSLGRRVALKVLPLAATFDAKHLQRFRNEAQAAAQLHHSNIVPVFAVGCERGVHFYAMQYIDGQSLAVFIEHRRRHSRPEPMSASGLDQNAVTRPENPMPGLTPVPAVSATTEHQPFSDTLTSQHTNSRKEYYRSIAKLFIQAAQGLDHAHQVGIVHRDIKPANLLVDGRGNLWITDFGLAQIRSDVQLTKTGDLIGTLRYMSPEQAAGQRAVIDHRADIYALGATLYEMATLEPIFAADDSIALLRAIERDEPISPRDLEPAVPIELETIILKAVSKSPTDRYVSAQEMADDLQRFLDDQPIRARRPSLFDRVRKWGRRHPSVIASALGFLVVCLIGLMISNRLISIEQAKTRSALERERQRSDEAERRFIQARKAVDLLFQVAEEELAERPQNQAARKKVLQTALAFYQDLIDQRADAPESRAELARVQDKVRGILADLTTLEGSQRFDLLVEPSVQSDLQLTPDQRTLADEISQRWIDQRLAFFRDSRGTPFEQRQQEFVALIREYEESLAGVLSEEQTIRLRQVAIQTKGLFAFEEPEVIAELKLTAAQKGKIRGIHEELIGQLFGKGFEKPPDKGPEGKFEKKSPFDWGKGPGDRKGRSEFGGESFRLREQAGHRLGVERVIALLSDEQRDRWNHLVGPRFLGSIRLSPAFSILPKDGPPRPSPPPPPR